MHCPLLDSSTRVSPGWICPSTGCAWAAASVAGPYWGQERPRLRGDDNTGNPTNRSSWNWHVCTVTSLQTAQKKVLINAFEKCISWKNGTVILLYGFFCNQNSNSLTNLTAHCDSANSILAIRICFQIFHVQIWLPGRVVLPVTPERNVPEVSKFFKPFHLQDPAKAWLVYTELKQTHTYS